MSGPIGDLKMIFTVPQHSIGRIWVPVVRMSLRLASWVLVNQNNIVLLYTWLSDPLFKIQESLKVKERLSRDV